MKFAKLSLVFLVLLCASVGRAEEQKQSAGNAGHRVVFEVTMAGDEQWNGVLNNVKNVREALGNENTQVMVIAHSNGLGLLLKKDNQLADRIKELADEGVVFAACENTMKKKNVSKDDLLPQATTVDSGVAEVVRKQEAGWTYVKSGS